MTPKKVFITGGTGTFGKEFTNYLLKKKNIKKIVVYSRDELKQSQMKQQLENFESRLRFLIGDVRDLQRLENCVADCDTIVHAAAMKRVEVCEQNPIEAIKTNIYGSENVISAALNNSFVKKSILISTDKAVNPINLYGSTKLSSERLFLSANNMIGPKNKKFSVIRYGNVANSRGSVIPNYLKLIKMNKKVHLPLTDKRMTRFIINIENALNFVYQSIIRMAGNEIFIPKLPSVRIIDIIKTLKSKHKIVGIGDGEKLHEVLLSKEEKKYASEFKNYFVVKNNFKTNPSKEFFSDYDSGTNKTFLSLKEISKFLDKIIKNELN